MERIKKVYDEDSNLIFEGEYINGNQNGKIIKSNMNKLGCEFEYINGKWNRKGKEYDYDGNLIFEGEYLNGKRWNGNGEEYDKTHHFQFKGEYINGKWNGKVKEYYFDQIFNKDYLKKQSDKNEKLFLQKKQSKFEGEYLNGERNGKGKEFNDFGNIIFEGEFLNGKRWKGKGK